SLTRSGATPASVGAVRRIAAAAPGVRRSPSAASSRAPRSPRSGSSVSTRACGGRSRRARRSASPPVGSTTGAAPSRRSSRTETAPRPGALRRGAAARTARSAASCARLSRSRRSVAMVESRYPSPRFKQEGAGVALKLRKVRYEKKGHIAYVTLDNPEHENCLEETVDRDLWKVWHDFRDDPKLYVAILTGAGAKSFC